MADNRAQIAAAARLLIEHANAAGLWTADERPSITRVRLGEIATLEGDALPIPDSRAQLAAAGALVEVKALLEAVRHAKEAFQNQDELDLLPIQHRPTVRHLAEQMHKALGPFDTKKGGA